MKTDIILAGVGGQGILSIAAVIGMAATGSELFVKQAEVHGMSQRGGAVQSHLRLSDKPVYSDLIPRGECDLILSVEPMEALRYVPYLSATGWIISNSSPFINIDDYPDKMALEEAYNALDNSILIDADSIASSLGSKRASNMVILGAASNKLGISFKALEDSIRSIFGPKGEEVVKLNLDALESGRKVADGDAS